LVLLPNIKSIFFNLKLIFVPIKTINRLLTVLFSLIFFLNLKLKAQEKVYVSKIEITGNKKTKEKIILRELAIQAGDSIIKAKVDSLFEIEKQKLSNRNLFNEIKLSLNYLTTTSAVLKVEVTERWYLFPGLDVSWADRNFNEWWYTYNHDVRRLKYGVYAGAENVTGNADNLNVNLIFGFLRQYGIQYRRPYIDKAQKTGFAVGASYNTFNNIQVKTVADRFEQFRQFEPVRNSRWAFATLTRRTGFYLNQSLMFRFNDNRVVDSVAIINPNYFLDGQTKQRFFSMVYSLRLDRRDNINYPLTGYLVSLQLNRLGLFKADDVNMGYALAAFSYFKPLAKKLFWATTIRGRTSYPKVQPYFQRQVTGFGIRNELVRGYEQYIIDGQHFVLFKNNLSYRILDKVYDVPQLPKQFRKIPLTLYLRAAGDLGYVSNNNVAQTQSIFSNKAIIGGGFGLDLVTFYNVTLQFNLYTNQQGEFRFVPKTRSDFEGVY
jgi:outer membrane protein assembly factor BamA